MQLLWRPLAPRETDHEVIWLAVSLGGLVLTGIWLRLGFPWPICLFHRLTGHPCGTCGATRCAIAFLHGHFLAALKWNPLAFLAYCGLSIFDVYAVAVLVARAPRLRLVQLTPRQKIFLRYSAVTLFALNWVYLLISNPPL